MNEDLREQIAELIDKATVSLGVNYEYSLEEFKKRKSEYKGFIDFWSCFFDDTKKQWCTFDYYGCSLRWHKNEREALQFIIEDIKDDERYFYTRERFIEEIEKCKKKMKMKVGIYLNEPYPGPSEDLYYVKGYEKVDGYWKTYYTTYRDVGIKSNPIWSEYRKEDDVLYDMYSGLPNNKKLYMSVRDMKKQILKARKSIRGIYITLDDRRDEALICGCCFDKKTKKYVYYETDDRNQQCSGSTSKHEEFCMADLYSSVMSELGFQSRM